MKTTIKTSDQVKAFIAALAPEPRRRMRLALRGLEEGRGDIKMLEDKLRGYSRLRVGPHRIIYYERAQAGQRVVECVYVNTRDVVYEIFSQLRLDDLS